MLLCADCKYVVVHHTHITVRKQLLLLNLSLSIRSLSACVLLDNLLGSIDFRLDARSVFESKGPRLSGGLRKSSPGDLLPSMPKRVARYT